MGREFPPWHFVNCAARPLVTCSLTKGIKNPLWCKKTPCKGTGTDSRIKLGKETVAGAHRGLKWVPHYSAQTDAGCSGHGSGWLRLCSGSAQALLRLCSGMLTLTQVRSPSAQVKAAAAHVRRLKRTSERKKLILSPWVF